MTKKNQTRLLRTIVHIGAWIPLALLIFDYFTNNLGTDPIREVTLRTGKASLVLLFLSLACTPIVVVTGWKQAVTVRRALGLYGFMYVCLHLLTFVGLDFLFDLDLILLGISEQQYVLIGMAAFLLLVPLALTSSKWSMRKLGKNWKRLHKLVYLVGILAVVHYTWLVKVNTEPFIYGGILALFFLLRWTPIKQKVRSWRQTIRRKRETAVT